MKILLIAAFLLLIVGVLNRDIKPTVKGTIEDKDTEEQQNQADNPTLDGMDDNELSLPSPEPTLAYQNKENKETQVNENTKASISINDFIYPNSIISQRSENTLELTSSDNPDSITDWYKERIRSQNMSTKSFVVTKTNDNVLNKFVATDGNLEIRVEITNNKGIDTTNIKVIIVK